MIGLVMAGGKGTRMKSNEEKLLLPYKQPLVLHVIDALKNSNCFEKIIAATSPNSPQTKNILVENNITIIETSGEGFLDDLLSLLGYPSGSGAALLGNTLRLKYQSFSFAYRKPTWRIPLHGGGGQYYCCWWQ